MFLFATDTVIAWAGAIGICLAILGAGRSLVLFFIMPVIVRWFVLPVLPAIGRGLLLFAVAHWMWLLPLLIIAPFVLLRLLAGLFESTLCLLLGPRFGARAAGHIGGVLSVRLIDWALGRRRGRPIPEFDEEEEV